MKRPRGARLNTGLMVAFSLCVAPFAAQAEDDIDCVKNQPSKIVCSISPEHSGRVRLKARSEHRTKDQAAGSASLKILINKKVKPCAQEENVPIAGTATVEAVCDLHLMQSQVYTITAIATNQNADASDIDLTVTSLRKQKPN